MELNIDVKKAIVLEQQEVINSIQKLYATLENDVAHRGIENTFYHLGCLRTLMYVAGINESEDTRFLTLARIIEKSYDDISILQKEEQTKSAEEK